MGVIARVTVISEAKPKRSGGEGVRRAACRKVVRGGGDFWGVMDVSVLLQGLSADFSSESCPWTGAPSAPPCARPPENGRAKPEPSLKVHHAGLRPISYALSRDLLARSQMHRPRHRLQCCRPSWGSRSPSLRCSPKFPGCSPARIYVVSPSIYS